MPSLSSLLADLSGAMLAGSPDTVVEAVASLAEAGEREISFFANPRYLPVLRRSQAGAVLVPKGYPAEAFGWNPEGKSPALVAVDNPSLAFSQLAERFRPAPVADVPGVHPTALVGENVRLGKDVCVRAHAIIEDDCEFGDGVYIGAGTYVGVGCVIGEGSRIYQNVTILERSRLGRRVIVHAGTVIGADGFGFELKDGRHVKIPQTGFVQIEDDVEIGANATIDRARFGRTHIGEGTKIDNLVQIAHNVVIGPHCLIVAQAGISGSTRLGKYVTLAGQAGLVGHIELGDGVIVGAQGGVSKSVAGGVTVWGCPAEPLDKFKMHQAHSRRLPKLVERVSKLEAELAEMREQLPARRDDIGR